MNEDCELDRSSKEWRKLASAFYSLAHNDQREFDALEQELKETKAGRLYFHSDGPAMTDVWEIPFLSTVARERTGYPAQKPEALLERIIKASSARGDLVADFFCGSGTTLAVAQSLGRRWLGCDTSAKAIRLARKRLTYNSDSIRSAGNT